VAVLAVFGFVEGINDNVEQLMHKLWNRLEEVADASELDRFHALYRCLVNGDAHRAVMVAAYYL